MEFVKEGAVQRVQGVDLVAQASRDCVNKTLKRLQERLLPRVLGQILYIMQGSTPAIRQRIAVALCNLTTPESPAGECAALMFLEKGALGVVLDMVTDAGAREALQRQAAGALHHLAESCGATAPIVVDPAPPEPKVYLGTQYVNNQTLSDVTFVIEGRQFFAHRIALLASSDIFRSMFDGHYREKDASTIPIPNIRWEVFEAMMRCIYTGEGA